MLSFPIQLALVVGALAQDPVELRWRFQPGEVRRYRSESEQTTDIEGPNAMQTAIRTVSVLRQEVRAVSPAGIASIDATYEALRIEIKTMMGALLFDSTLQGEDAKQNSKELESLSGLVGAPFHFELDAQGRLVAQKGLAELTEKAFAGTPQDPMSQGVLRGLRASFGPDTLARSYELNRLPEEAVAAGATWKRSFSQSVPMLGKLTYTVDSKLGALEDRGGHRCASVPFEMHFALERESGADSTASGPMQLETQLGDCTGNGTLVFDVTAGRLLEIKSTGQMEMTMSMQRPDASTKEPGMQMQIAVDTTTSVVLLGAKDPPFPIAATAPVK